MPGYKQNIGKLGEDIAAKYLVEHGYRILERNYRKPWGEIDIVGKKSGILTFFEVKTQKAGFEWRPEENVGWHKKRQLKRIITTYLKESQMYGIEWQIDILAIELDFQTKNTCVEHIPNILLN